MDMIHESNDKCNVHVMDDFECLNQKWLGVWQHASYYYTNKVALCFRTRRPCMFFGNEIKPFICLQKKKKSTTLTS